MRLHQEDFVLNIESYCNKLRKSKNPEIYSMLMETYIKRDIKELIVKLGDTYEIKINDGTCEIHELTSIEKEAKRKMLYTLHASIMFNLNNLVSFRYYNVRNNNNDNKKEEEV